MGNHEYNAIAFATPDPTSPGRHYRLRHADTIHHHSTFLDAVGGADSGRHRELVAFFKEMPLWLDLDGIRIVHACWSGAAMSDLRPHLSASNCLTEQGFEAAMTRGTAAFAACEILLKGPEMKLPAGIWYRDAQGAKRTHTRTRWWDATAATIRAACVETLIADQLREEPIPQQSMITLDERKPVLFGHYWMQGHPFLLHPLRTCLDFSIAKGGVLCAYRFDGEPALSASKLIWVG